VSLFPHASLNPNVVRLWFGFDFSNIGKAVCKIGVRTYYAKYIRLLLYERLVYRTI